MKRRKTIRDTSVQNKKLVNKSWREIGFILGLTLILSVNGLNVSAESSGGSEQPKKAETGNRADQNLRSLARVNPSTLAMELSVPLTGYPGRNGNSVPVNFSYSSKTWMLKTAHTWWYPLIYFGERRYVTDVNARFGEHSAAGWTSSLMPPRIDDRLEIYNIHGKPYGDSTDTEGLDTSFMQTLQGIGNSNRGGESGSSFPGTCGGVCSMNVEISIGGNLMRSGCVDWEFIRCRGTFDDPDPTQNMQTPNYMYYVKRLRIVMPDGSSQEFRQSDANTYCGTVQTGCATDFNGTYLSADGSKMRLERAAEGSTLYLPDGGRYIFPAEAQSNNGLYANEYIDGDGNKMYFSEETDVETGQVVQKITDTLERQIVDPIPHNWITQTQTTGTKQINMPGLGTNPQQYELKWERLKQPGCEESTDPNCAGQSNEIGGALEDQSKKLFYETRYYCQGNLKQDLLINPSNLNDPANEVLFPLVDTGVRPCNGFDIERDSEGDPVLDQNGNPIPHPTRFNPIVLSEVKLPNNQKYVFKYNRFGEISKIIYPTGSYETFVYGAVVPMSDTPSVYDQTNRGVIERKVFSSADVLEQRWQYSATSEFQYPNLIYKVTTTAPKEDNPLGEGIKTETYMHVEPSSSERFGFSEPRTGLPKEEVVRDENGNIRSRTLTEYTTKDSLYQNFGYTAKRDARASRSVSVTIEGGQALAVLSESEYDDNGSADASYFSHLNLERAKTHHYKSIPLSVAESGTLAQIAAYFSGAPPAAISETDYTYDANYKARGISSLPQETRAVDPANNQVLAKSQVLYDEPGYPIINAGSAGTTWQDPQTNYRGNATTSRTWVRETDTWLETHAQYDYFGNQRKAWDASGDANRFSETEYSSQYNYAYPTKITAPAPGAINNPTGTDQKSEVSTVYDPTTGLPLTVTNHNDLTTNADDLTTTMEYNDSLLRPTAVVAPNGLRAETIYNDTPGNQWVKVRKQIDETNWDEATTFTDSLGRTVKTQAKDSQGDVFTEAQYDNMGRVKQATSPYRVGEQVFWTKSRYDELGRSVETFAPALINDLPNAQSTGTTAYSISAVPNFVGMVVTGTDAAGKKGRSITNSLGQLVRVDEATGNNDLGDISVPNQPTVYTYSPLGKMVKVQQGAQNRFFLYDSIGRLLRVRQPEQDANASLNLTDSITGNNQWTAGFTYDNNGNVITATDAKGVVITNSYDNANRVVQRSYSGEPAGQATPQVNFAYDGVYYNQANVKLLATGLSKGAMTQTRNSVSASQTVAFDNYGRALTYQQTTDGQTYASQYKYNIAGTLIEETYPSGRVVKNAFESDGDLASISSRSPNGDFKNFASNFSYTSTGIIERLQIGNGRWETAKLNSRQQITELALGISQTDTSLWKVNYDYGEIDASGNLNAAKNTGNIAKQTISFAGLTNPFVQTYKYDSVNRLTEARETSGANQTWIQTFGYDRYGNRTNFSQTIGSQQLVLNNINHPSIDANTNRFTAGQGYTYDYNGNIINDPAYSGRSFTFNGDNKQVLVKDVNNNVVGTYFYDGDGKRIKKVTNLETTIFVYSGGKLVAEYSTQEPPENPTINYTATDSLGSPRVITDKMGNVTSRRDFMPFGEELLPDVNYRTTNQKYSLTGDSVRQKFTGYQKDLETGLDFAEARYYNNQHGRFTAVDPLLASGKSANPQTFNRYVYVMNNPLAFTDPSGECPSGTCPASYSGTVYTKTIDGKVRYNNERPDDSWAVLKAGTDITIKDNTDNFEYRIFNFGEGTNGGSGWYRISNEPSSFESMLPSTWDTHYFLGEERDFAAVSNPRGGKFTITPEGETDIDAYQNRIDTNKMYALLGAAQYATLGGLRSSPSIPKSSSPIGGNFAQRLFFSNTLGKESTLFGNNRFDLTGADRAGILNQPGSRFKIGWSNTIAERDFINPKPVSPIAGTEGGMQFRFGFGAKRGTGQAEKHLYLPKTFVPESRSNPFGYRRPKANR